MTQLASREKEVFGLTIESSLGPPGNRRVVLPVEAPARACYGESAGGGKRRSVAFGMDEDDRDRNRNRDGNKYNNDRR